VITYDAGYFRFGDTKGEAMTTREPKSRHTNIVELISRKGDRAGRLEFSSGNATYFRKGGKSQTLRLTYRQLVSILEKELSYRDIDASRLKIPGSRAGMDFYLEVAERDVASEESYGLFTSRLKLSNLDPRRVDEGTYQFSQDMATGRQSKRYVWFAHISVQAALWIVHRYIEKFLVPQRRPERTDSDTVVSKAKMRTFLVAMLKRLD